MLTLRAMIRILYAVIWSSALVLSAALFAMSTSSLSRMIFALAALVALRHILYGPIDYRQRQR